MSARAAVAVALAVAGCGGPTSADPGAANAAAAPATLDGASAPAGIVPRLAPPAPIDLGVFGAGYLSAVALQFEPGWGQFLDDCRLRLPPGDPLNVLALSASAELAVDRSGRVSAVRLARPSGNAEFDRAVHDAIADADVARLPAPPAELLSDDDHVHLRWLFARDHRQAGPATAEVVVAREPIREVVERLLAAGDVARAARRVVGEPATPARAAAAERVMIAALREALASADGVVQRAAIVAIGRAHVTALAAEVRAQLAESIAVDQRVAASIAVAQLGDRDAVAVLAAGLATDLAAGVPQLVVADVGALVALQRPEVAADRVREALPRDGAAPSEVALAALAVIALAEAAHAFPRWFAHGDARTRAGVCAALGGGAVDVARPLVTRGLDDADATVRATCAATAAHAGIREAVLPRLRAHTRDRDRTVRANVLAALAAAEPDTALVRAAADDAAPEVRAALAGALAVGDPRARELVHALAVDRDPDVRAAAWSALAAAPTALTADDRAAALAAAIDPAAQVRRALPPLLADGAAAEAALARLAGDDAPDVRAAADVELVRRRGRAASTDSSLARLAAAPRASTERVRIALAWLLAP